MTQGQEAKRVRIDGQPERRAKIVALAPQPDIRDVLKAVFLPAERENKNGCSKRHNLLTNGNSKNDNDKNDKNYDTEEPKD